MGRSLSTAAVLGEIRLPVAVPQAGEGVRRHKGASAIAALVELEAQAGRVGERRTRRSRIGFQPPTRSFRQGTSNSANASWIRKFGVLTSKCRHARQGDRADRAVRARRAGPGPAAMRGDLLADEHAAAVGQVHLHHVGGPRAPSAGRNRPGCRAARRPRSAARHRSLDLGQQVEALGHDRLLAPGRVEAAPAGGSSRRPRRPTSRPWNSIISPTPAPTASRTAATIRLRPRPARGVSSFQAVPNGSNFSAR